MILEILVKYKYIGFSLMAFLVGWILIKEVVFEDKF